MTMITPSYLGETIEYSSLHACRSTLEDPTSACAVPTIPFPHPQVFHLISFIFSTYLDGAGPSPCSLRRTLGTVGSVERTVLLGLLMALGAFGVDTMLPGLNRVAREYGVPETRA